MNLNASVQFFEAQFQRQAQGEERVLNRFEQAALPHLQGQVLDFGCGMGALAVAFELAAHQLDVVIDHATHELCEAHLGLPAERGARLRRVAHELVDLGGAEIF